MAPGEPLIKLAQELRNQVTTMLSDPLVAGLFVVLLVLAVLAWLVLEIVSEGERRALVVDGEYRGLLEPGVHVVRPFGASTTSIDVDPQLLTAVVDGAESSDDGAVDVEATVEFEVTDPGTAFEQVGNPAPRFLQDVELAIHDVVESFPANDLQADSAQFAPALEARLDAETAPYGITIHDVTVGSTTVRGD